MPYSLHKNRVIPFSFGEIPPCGFLENVYICSVNNLSKTMMRKILIVFPAVMVLLSSCGTYAGQGAAAGAHFGSVLGSAIGGISGGWRGSDIGTVVGMAGGAAIGAAIGAAADQKQEEKIEAYKRERSRRQAGRYDDYDIQGSRSDDSGFDSSNSGDDRIDFDGAGPRDGQGGYTASVPRSYDPQSSDVEPGYSVRYNSLIEIRNARIIDHDRDGIFRAGEECQLTFEIMNRSSLTLYDVQPTVFDVTGNKHIHISPNLHIESIAPNSGVRYTATILADRKLKDGTAVIRVAVAQGNREITSQVKEFTVRTSRH